MPVPSWPHNGHGRTPCITGAHGVPFHARPCPDDTVGTGRRDAAESATRQTRERVGEPGDAGPTPQDPGACPLRSSGRACTPTRGPRGPGAPSNVPPKSATPSQPCRASRGLAALSLCRARARRGRSRERRRAGTWWGCAATVARRVVVGGTDTKRFYVFVVATVRDYVILPLIVRLLMSFIHRPFSRETNRTCERRRPPG